jgi:hypothetical protein
MEEPPIQINTVALCQDVRERPDSWQLDLLGVFSTFILDTQDSPFLYTLYCRLFVSGVINGDQLSKQIDVRVRHPDGQLEPPRSFQCKSIPELKGYFGHGLPLELDIHTAGMHLIQIACEKQALHHLSLLVELPQATIPPHDIIH